MLTRARLREKMKPFVRRFRGMAQAYRLSILYLLAHEPLEVKDLADHLGIKGNLTAHHLKQLKISGWVIRQKQGNLVTYALSEKNFSEFYRLFEDTPFERDFLGKQKKHI